MWYIKYNTIRKDPNLRQDLSVHTTPPPQIETPGNISDIINATISATDIILNRVHRMYIPTYLAPYLEYVVYDVCKLCVNTKLGQKFEEIAIAIDGIDLFQEMYNIIVSKQTCFLKIKNHLPFQISPNPLQSFLNL